MPVRRPHVSASAAQSELAAALADLRASLALPDAFPAEVDAEASATKVPTPPPTGDRRDIEFVTIDPPGSMDLDQALHIERARSGYGVHYAIADVPGWVRPEGAVDDEARRRGQTLYAADGRIPLHPQVLSEDRASLLPDADRSAFVWSFELDGSANLLRTGLERATVRSRERLDYGQAQARIDAGTGGPDSPLALLREVGTARIALESARGGASLNTPDEEIVRGDDGSYSIQRRELLPVEDWNAQLSLLTGMAAAAIMLEAKIGILRTMPAPSAEQFDAFRRQTEVLGRPWPADASYGDYLKSLDRSDPVALAVLQAATGLFRGAGYVAMNGTAPTDPTQSALAAPYAHVTAPLRRLVDRWGLVVCEALQAGRSVPDWAAQSLEDLPAVMEESSRLASQLDAGSIARVEAAVLSDRVGQSFAATIIALRGEKAVIQLADPAVTASCPAPPGARAGESIAVVLEAADIRTGTIKFTAAAAAAA
jgi:exoribonuclease R